MVNDVLPLLLSPQPSRRLWGGRRLGRLLGQETTSGADPIGEAWLVGPASPVAGGPWAGHPLQDVADALGERLLGTVPTARYGSKFPLLLKLIDAAEPLSIQVHPDDAFALREEADTGYLGKEEAWYVLEADPGAEIVWGFARDVDHARVREAVRDESLESLVQRVPVAAGDVVYNPAGKVHAIGAGIYLFEVQQASDLTYRLYDYGRRDAQGRTRELHLDRALAVADLTATGAPKVAPRELGGWTELVATPHFMMERRIVDGGLEADTHPASLEALTWVRGRGRLIVPGDEPEAPRASQAFAHEAVVLPAALGGYRVEGRGELIRCRLPATET